MTPEPRNLSAFIRSVEEQLQLRGCEFSLCDWIAWATSVWALARLDPDAAKWAGAFLESRAAAGA